MSLRAVKGTRDLLPPETSVWQAVESMARRVFATYGYAEIRTPVLESTELFVRGIGDSTEVVSKQMFTFEDRKGRSLTLRPEMTAGVARAIAQARLGDGGLPLRLFYIGPNFRYERPQKGRFREFHQIGAELVGDPGPGSDAELIAMLVRFLGALGFGSLVVLLNTVGDDESRASYRTALIRYLTPLADRLGEDSRRRLETNPLRILDTKVEEERALLEEAPHLDEHLSPASREHFEGLTRLLDRLGVRYRRDPRLVRGLDYYTRTVFEIVSEDLGAQDAIVGGGRYDGLLAQLGGPDLPGIGFAIGEDRLVEVLPETTRLGAVPRAPALVIPVGAVGTGEVLELADEMRRQGLSAEAELSGRSLKAALKLADRRGCRFAILLGDEELVSGEVTLKQLATGEQWRIPRAEAMKRIEAAG